MFISEQYGEVSALSGDYWDALFDIGCGHYYLAGHGTLNEYRDVDMMLINL